MDPRINAVSKSVQHERHEIRLIEAINKHLVENNLEDDRITLLDEELATILMNDPQAIPYLCQQHQLKFSYINNKCLNITFLNFSGYIEANFHHNAELGRSIIAKREFQQGMKLGKKAKDDNQSYAMELVNSSLDKLYGYLFNTSYMDLMQVMQNPAFPVGLLISNHYLEIHGMQIIFAKSPNDYLATQNYYTLEIQEILPPVSMQKHIDQETPFNHEMTSIEYSAISPHQDSEQQSYEDDLFSFDEVLTLEIEDCPQISQPVVNQPQTIDTSHSVQPSKLDEKKFMVALAFILKNYDLCESSNTRIQCSKRQAEILSDLASRAPHLQSHYGIDRIDIKRGKTKFGHIVFENDMSTTLNLLPDSIITKDQKRKVIELSETYQAGYLYAKKRESKDKAKTCRKDPLRPIKLEGKHPNWIRGLLDYRLDYFDVLFYNKVTLLCQIIKNQQDDPVISLLDNGFIFIGLDGKKRMINTKISADFIRSRIALLDKESSTASAAKKASKIAISTSSALTTSSMFSTSQKPSMTTRNGEDETESHRLTTNRL